jgi:hypothetical protein
MSLRMCKMLCGPGVIAIAAAVLAGCSGSHSGNTVPDGAADGSADCIQMQRDYVDAKLGPTPPGDVAAAVHVVLGASDFPQGMPYCSGPRPGSP